MKNIVFFILLTKLLFPATAENYDSLYKKYGDPFGAAEVIKVIAGIMSDHNPNMHIKSENEEWVGLMGISNFDKEEIPFLKNTKIEKLLDPETNIKAGAYLLKQCIKSFHKTPIAIRCFSESISKEGAIEIAKKFKKDKAGDK